jgi:hypothetical protein
VTGGPDAAPTHLAQHAEPAIVALSPELIHSAIHSCAHRVIHWQLSWHIGQEA